jgi:hypothetical protein
LHPGDKYEGLADIKFRIQKKEDIFLDFSGRKVEQILINKQSIEPSQLHNEK